jgi:hypothetical protein
MHIMNTALTAGSDMEFGPVTNFNNIMLTFSIWYHCSRNEYVIEYNIEDGGNTPLWNVGIKIHFTLSELITL